MPKRRRSIIAATALMVLALDAVAADAQGEPWIEGFAFGIVAHDRGPTSDEYESGVDPNIEVRLRGPRWPAWRAIGAPSLHAGLTPNFSGDTSALYGGITYDWNMGLRGFLSGGAGVAVHDGPLHAADRTRCEQDSDCGFGSRGLWRVALELGIRISGDQAITLFYDHMSHYGTLADENEGIDHTGIRYHWRY